MKKSLLFAGLLAMGLAVSAQNPYAYNASTSDVEGTDVPVTYSLNAPAERVIVDFIDGTGTVAKSVELDAEYLTAGEHTALVSLEELTAGAEYTLAVRVKGAAIESPQFKLMDIFWSPYGIAVDNDPMSKYFGRMLVTECQPTVNNDGSYYTSLAGTTGVGVGIYVYDPQLNRVLNPDGKYGYVGDPNIQTSYAYADYAAAGPSTGNTFSLKKVRISKDGRIFVGGLDVKNGQPLWEVNPDNLAEWSPIFVGEKSKYEDTGYDCNLYNEDGEFVAGYSACFAVTGEGDDLKLTNLSCTRGQTFSYGAYQMYEYPLGTATTWDAAADEMNEVIPLSMSYTISAQSVSIDYDPNGNIWWAQYRGAPNASQPSIKHASKNADGEWEEDYSIINGEDYPGYTFNRGGGIACSLDGSQVAFSKGNQNVTIFDVTYDEFGTPTLTEKINITTPSGNHTGIRGFNDLAWDYAGNLYACDNGWETLFCIQVPRTAAAPAGMKRAQGDDPNEVTTPLRPEFNITVPDDINTGVSNISSKAVESVQYINMNGQVSNVPFDGVNVVITRYADGTKSTTKIVK